MRTAGYNSPHHFPFKRICYTFIYVTLHNILSEVANLMHNSLFYPALEVAFHVQNLTHRGESDFDNIRLTESSPFLMYSYILSIIYENFRVCVFYVSLPHGYL